MLSQKNNSCTLCVPMFRCRKQRRSHFITGFAYGNPVKSHDATQKKCSYVVHFNVPCDWFETNSLHQKRYSEGDKKFVGVGVYWEE